MDCPHNEAWKNERDIPCNVSDEEWLVREVFEPFNIKYGDSNPHKTLFTAFKPNLQKTCSVSVTRWSWVEPRPRFTFVREHAQRLEQELPDGTKKSFAGVLLVSTAYARGLKKDNNSVLEVTSDPELRWGSREYNPAHAHLTWLLNDSERRAGKAVWLNDFCRKLVKAAVKFEFRGRGTTAQEMGLGSDRYFDDVIDETLRLQAETNPI